jgi:3-keto-5-aminohexanoate cleavage enzyme
MNAIAIFMGGHVRTGLEDCPYLSYADRLPATNEALLRRAAELARVAGRRLATPAARGLLGLAAA